MKTLYTFAVNKSVCYGHGDYQHEDQILRTGSYGEGDFPPVFSTREKAEAFLENRNGQVGWKIVELHLVD